MLGIRAGWLMLAGMNIMMDIVSFASHILASA
jgi:hypothetical protein